MINKQVLKGAGVFAAGVASYTAYKWLTGGYEEEEEEEDEEEEEEEDEEEEVQVTRGKKSEEVSDSERSFDAERERLVKSLTPKDLASFSKAFCFISDLCSKLPESESSEIGRNLHIAIAARNSSAGLSEAFPPMFALEMIDLVAPKIEEGIRFAKASDEEKKQVLEEVSNFLQVLRTTCKKPS